MTPEQVAGAEGPMSLADKLRALAEDQRRIDPQHRNAGRCEAEPRWAFVNGRAEAVRYACDGHRTAVRERLVFHERELWSPDLVEVPIQDAKDVRPWKVIDDVVPWQIES
jgi:hypothetical protein